MKAALTQALEALEEVALDAATQALAMAKTVYSDGYKPNRLKGAEDDVAKITAAIAACRAALAQPDDARLAEANKEIERLRGLLQEPQIDTSHKCRKCLFMYTPAGADEDCPHCGFDGIAIAAQGEA